MKTCSKVAILILSGFISFSCSDDISNCLRGQFPEIDQTSIPPATLQQPYSTEFTVSVRNNPADNRYDYVFELLSDPPAGLIFEQTASRKARLSGTPAVSGSYTVKVRVTLEDPDAEDDDEDDGLCLDFDTEKFVLEVRP